MDVLGGVELIAKDGRTVKAADVLKVDTLKCWVTDPQFFNEDLDQTRFFWSIRASLRSLLFSTPSHQIGVKYLNLQYATKLLNPGIPPPP